MDDQPVTLTDLIGIDNVEALSHGEVSGELEVWCRFEYERARAREEANV